MTADQRRKAQARARRLHAEGHSHRQIAAAVRVGKTTITRWLADPAPESQPLANIQTDDGSPVAGAEEGNDRALTHGAYSEASLRPVREEHLLILQATYPTIDAGRRVVQAQRLAQITLGAAWLDKQHGVVRDDEGRVYDVADKVSKWSAQAERWYEQAEAEARKARRFGDLEGHLVDDEEEGTDGATT